MTLDWQSLITQIGTSAAALAVLGFLSRSIVLHWLSKDIAGHKDRLDRQAATELEQLRNTLSKEAHEHNVTFARLHERRAEVIAETYGRLDALHLAFRRWVALTKPANTTMAESAAETGQAFQRLGDYYYPHSIWLDRATCDAINEIVDHLHSAFIDLTMDLDQRGWPRDREAMKAAHSAINRAVPAARALLEQRFRALLGVEPAGSTAVIPAPKAG